MSGDIKLGITLTGDASGLVGEVKVSKKSLDNLAEGGKKAGETIASGMEKATQATLTWNQFTGQRMAAYMKELGGHAPAIKKIAAEWKEYKASGVNALDGVAGASRKQTAAEKAASIKSNAFSTLQIRSNKEIRAEIEQVTKAYKRLAFRGSASASELARASKVTKQRITELKNELKGASKQTDSFASSIKGLLGGTAAFYAISRGIKEVASSGMDLETISSKLAVSLDNVVGELDYISAVSDRLGLVMRSTADAYASFAAATKGTILEGEKTRRVFEGVTTAASALGLGADQTNGALKALEQMVSKGTVSAEELRGQLGERIPGAFKLAADAMGITQQELGKIMQSGELLASDLLPRLADAMQERFGKQAAAASANFRQETNRLTSAMDALTASIFNGGAGDAMAWFVRIQKDGIEGLTTFINVMSNADEQSALAIQISNTSAHINRLKKSVTEYNNQKFHPLELFGAKPAEDMFVKLQTLEDKLKTLTERRAALMNPANNTTSKGTGELPEKTPIDPKLAAKSLADAKSLTAQLGAAFDDTFTKTSDKYVETWQQLVATQGEGSAQVKSLESAYQSWLDSTWDKQAANDEKRTQKATAQEQKRVNNVIQLQSAKYLRLNQAASDAALSNSERQFTQLDRDLAAMADERQRLVDHKIWTDELESQYAEARIARAQTTADAVGEIEDLETENRLQRITDGEQAAYGLKAQFQQLVTDNQQVNLGAMAGNIASFAKASTTWDKWTGEQKLGFAAATMGALSGLLKSENRKQFEIGKASAQGENAINTYLGATKAFQSMSGIPYVGPILGAVAAAAVVASGMANAKKISGTKMGGSTGGVAVPTISAGGGGAMPTAGLNPSTGIPQSQQQQTQQQAPQVNITVQALHPDAISPDTLQMIADGLSPALNDSFGRGQQLAVRAA